MTSSAFDPAASAGLFVGVSSFEDERIHGVPFAVDDAVDLAHLFTLELGLVIPERVVLLLSGEPRKPESIKWLERLVERGARCRNARMPDIYRYLGELTRSTEEEGLFVLSVATHGVSDQGGDFLLAADSLRERTLRTGVAVAEVFDEVARAVAPRRLVLLDACRERLGSGTRGEAESAMTQSFVDAITQSSGLVVLSGATLGGFAYDDKKHKNGVFTAAILDGLRGEAPAGPEGWITVRTLADFVQQRVVEWVRRNRPDHAAKSLGIARRIEATAEALPLAPHPGAMQERERYRTRREAALALVMKNQGRVLNGALWDEIVARLPEEKPSQEAEQLLGEIEALDGSERAQRSLRDYLRELSDRVSSQAPSRNAWKREKEPRRTEAAMPAARREQVELGGGGPASIGRWKNATKGTAVVAGALLVGIIGTYLLGLTQPADPQLQRLINATETPAGTALGGSELPEKTPTSTWQPPRGTSAQRRLSPTLTPVPITRETPAQGRQSLTPAPAPTTRETPRQLAFVFDGPKLVVSEAAAQSGLLFDLFPLAKSLGGMLTGYETADGGKGYLLRIEDTEVVMGDRSAIIMVGEKVLSLSQPVAHDNRKLLVPLDFLRQTFGDLAGFTFEWKQSMQRLVISRRAADGIEVLFDVVNLNGVTSVVLQFAKRPRYQIVQQPGRIDIRITGDRLALPSMPSEVMDPLVRGVTIAREQVQIQLAPGTQASNYVLENPFRIVFDVNPTNR